MLQIQKDELELVAAGRENEVDQTPRKQQKKPITILASTFNFCFFFCRFLYINLM